MSLSVWIFAGSFVAICVSVFVIILIVEIRTTLDRTNQSLEEMKKTLQEIKDKQSV